MNVLTIAQRSCALASFLLLGLLFGNGSLSAQEAEPLWKVGFARQVITPGQPMWMGGYAARTKPSEGKVHDLFAKAIAFEDAAETRQVLVTMDLIGIPRSLREFVEQAAQKRFNLPPESLMLNASHTHCGPELRFGKAIMLQLSPEESKKIEAYRLHLQEVLVELVGKALDDLQPAKVGFSHGRAGFAMNRRLPTPSGFINRPYADGPVDHEVPVLQITSPTGELRGLLFGYACHNTTLGIQKFCGDYAGFAQEYLEQAHAGVVAMFVAGCGGDQNPQPRRTLELAQQHGRSLSNAVEAAIISPLEPITGSIRAAIEVVPLEFAQPPSKVELIEQAGSKNKYERRHAEILFAQLEANGKLPETYPYLVQVLRLGDQLLIVALAGETVVDYSLRLKQELAGPRVWVAGYCNDVFAYIPSRRVLLEGGYEAGRAMRYSIFPGPWKPSVEELVISSVHRLAKKTVVEKKDEQLFVPKPLSEKKSFTSGIEGPACDRDGNIYAVNFERQHTIGRTTPDGKSELFLELPEGSTGNGIRFDTDGMMFVADYSGHNVLKVDPKTLQVEVFAHHDKMSQPNDIAIAADGTLYASDPNWSNNSGQLWRIDRDRKVTQLAADLGTTNGIEVSPDGKTLYVNESVQRSVWAYPFLPDGKLGERSLLISFEENSLDGMRCDVEGNLYITRHGAGVVVKLSPVGKILQEIDVLGAMPSNICFGGPDGRTAYVTEVEHQRLVQFRVDQPGLSWQRLQAAGN